MLISLSIWRIHSFFLLISHRFIHVYTRINMFLGNDNWLLSIVLYECHFIFEGCNNSLLKLLIDPCHDHTFRLDTITHFEFTFNVTRWYSCSRIQFIQFKRLIVFSMIVFLRVLLMIIFISMFLDELSSRIELHIIIMNFWTSKSSRWDHIIPLDNSTRCCSCNTIVLMNNSIRSWSNSNINVFVIDIISLNLCSMIINMLGLTCAANFFSSKILMNLISGNWCSCFIWHKIWEFKFSIFLILSISFWYFIKLIVTKIIMIIMTTGLKSFEVSHASCFGNDCSTSSKFSSFSKIWMRFQMIFKFIKFSLMTKMNTVSLM